MNSERITFNTTEVTKNNEVEAPEFFIKSFADIQEEDRPLVGEKGYNLSRLYQAGFPVPEGYIISTSAHLEFKKSGEIPQLLIDEIRKRKVSLDGEVALRSSATCEDGLEHSMAGVFTTHYVSSDSEIEPALRDIYDQSQSDESRAYLEKNGIDQKVEMAIVEQKLITPDYSGVVYTKVNDNDMLVQYIDGFGTALVDGETHGSAFLLDRETTKIKESSDFEERRLSRTVIDQIIQYSDQARELFDGLDQDIEFAIVGDKVYILQSRALTTELENVTLGETIEETLFSTQEKIRKIVAEEKKELGTETVVLSDSNFSELLPRPKEMDLGIFTYIFTGSDGIPGGIQLGREQMGYSIDDKTVGYTQLIGGRPYFSLARDSLTFYSNFPETQREYIDVLTNEYLTAATLNPENGKYPEMGLYLQDPTLNDLKIRFGNRAEEYYSKYLEFKDSMGESAKDFLDEFYEQDLPSIEEFILAKANVDFSTFSTIELIEYSTEILEHLRTVSCVDFVKAARLGFYYSQRMQQSLHENFHMNEEEVEQSFARLSQGLDGSKITEVNIAIDQEENQEEAYRIGSDLVGHYSTSEMLEIRHPRLNDDTDALKAYVDGIRQKGDYTENFEKQREDRLNYEKELLDKANPRDKKEIAEIVAASQTYMSLRETVKYHFVREYALIRNALEELNGRLGMEDGDIYSLYPRELVSITKDPDEIAHIIDARKRAFANFSEIDMPPVIREADIDGLQLLTEQNEDFSELHGKFLAGGEALQGSIINIDDFDKREDLEAMIEAFTNNERRIILAASQMNLGHDPYISMAAGLIIKNAAIASHGAQRAREMGRGAIGGINTKLLKTGMDVYFDPQQKLLRKIIPEQQDDQSNI